MQFFFNVHKFISIKMPQLVVGDAVIGCKTRYQQEHDGKRADINVSFLVSKSGKPHKIVKEIILPAVEELDESIHPNNEARLIFYVRFIKYEKICEELSFAKNMEIYTKDESMFDTVKPCFKTKALHVIKFSEQLVMVSSFDRTLSGVFCEHLNQN
ncbi:hypothetical protein RF11_09314 [Thelohanellus kitauei]|uniref:Uncharacterized protein n=1 Tax=Thelohanellus kitauei TaxID=669202 RepID=A0A0C2MT71_THEKT|nr:hypothetical protein RF11_09314 [Thelohanellus kitauei]